MTTGGTLLIGIVILIGLIGVVVPLLPGTMLIFGAVLVWALFEQTLAGWVTLAVVTVLVAVTTAVKYLWPVQRMRRAEVSNTSLVIGGVLGIVGFFVIPVLGLPIGFVGGIYLAELLRRQDQRLAWTSTVHALKGVALSMLVELTGALAAAGIWLGAVLLG
jgi:uncharacterized protein YqgC (DUF456 family)